MLKEKELRINNVNKTIDKDGHSYVLLSTKDLTNEEIEKMSSSKIMIKNIKIKMREN